MKCKFRNQPCVQNVYISLLLSVYDRAVVPNQPTDKFCEPFSMCLPQKNLTFLYLCLYLNIGNIGTARRSHKEAPLLITLEI